MDTSISICSRADNNSVVSGQIWLKFESMQGIMHIHVTSNFKKDLINRDRKKWRHQFEDGQGQLNPWSIV